MLKDLRKRLGSLFAPAAEAVVEVDEANSVPEGAGEASTEGPSASELETVILARREAHKREARLILSERIHNRAAVLAGELRNELLQHIHQSLDDEVASKSLHELLRVTLDPAFTAKLDHRITELVEKLLEKIRTEFEKVPEAEHLLPRGASFVQDLQLYRDQILRTHLLEQIEVLALPPMAQVFPEGNAGPTELKEPIARYWSSCQEALDKFFRSVDMVLLDGARDGLRLSPPLITDRLVAAQYRNGYRVLEERFRAIFAEILRLSMSVEPSRDTRTMLDRRVVDDVIVALAYFIRGREQAEPREALKGRAELFREIVDKLVVIPDSFGQSAEAIKPVLRRSIEQARPLAQRDFPFLRSIIQSLNPAAIHRTTALLTLFETLVRSELDEETLADLETIIRLSKAQYHLHQQIKNAHPHLLKQLKPLDRFQDEDAEMLAQLIEHQDPPFALIEDLIVRLGYEDPAFEREDDHRRLLRVIAVMTLSARELTAWSFLYTQREPSAEELARLARTFLRRLRPTQIGTDTRQGLVQAVPLPVELNRALLTIGYMLKEEVTDRLGPFRNEIDELIQSGEGPKLAVAIEWIHKLRTAFEDERVRLGTTTTDADPYLVEVWLRESGAMVGLVLYRGNGFGEAPVEVLTREPGDDRKATEEKLRRQLLNQAIIYRAFHRLFSRDVSLPKEPRRELPAFVKAVYETTEPNRHLLLLRLRYAREVLARIDQFARYIVEADSAAAADAKAVGQILVGLNKKLDQLSQEAERTRSAADIHRLVREYMRALKFLNTASVRAINPWLARQTAELAEEFDFKREEVADTIRRATSLRGLQWEEDVESWEAHHIRGTLGCRALLRLADGSSKVVLLQYDRQVQTWKVRYLGPRLTDVVREELRKKGKTLPDDYDEKYEQPTFSLEEQSCRFLLVKRNVARVEATLVLDYTLQHNPWVVAFLKYNEEVLIDRLG